MLKVTESDLLLDSVTLSLTSDQSEPNRRSTPPPINNYLQSYLKNNFHEQEQT